MSRPSTILLSLLTACAFAADDDWKKFDTKPGPLAPRQVLTPGVFDPKLRHLITFPPNGGMVDTELPHAGLDKNGKPWPAIQARVQQGLIWIDFDGDGKPEAGETRAPGPDGFTEPFSCELHFDDGTSAPYSFRFRTLVENQQYALFRAMERSFDFQGEKIRLIDDDSNGRYNDENDVALIGDQPLALLGKYFLLKERYYEWLVQASGTRVEIRPVPALEVGAIDPFKNFTPPQKAEGIRLHTVIFSGPQGSFSFDDRRRILKVPVGPYDISFALFERTKELVYVRKGEKTSFNVEGGKVATPEWGGDIKALFPLSSDGETVTVGKPEFTGKGSELWAPEHFKTTPVTANASHWYRDKQRIDHVQPFGQRRFDVLPDGSLKPLVFKRYRNSDDEYQIAVEYTSGIMGRILDKQKFSFVYKKKAPEKKTQ